MEAARVALEAYARGDRTRRFRTAIRKYSPFRGHRGRGGKGLQGHQGVRNWYADTFDAFEEVRTPVSQIRDLGDRIILLGQLKARGRESGVFSSPLWAGS